MPCSEQSKPSILVVDDESGILKLLANALHVYGFEVLTADDGRKAVETYRSHRSGIDIVLLDVQMPGWDGVRTLIELQRIDPAVVVAFMSATPGAFAPAVLLRLGVVQVFDKPFPSLKYVAETVKELIERISRRD